MSTPQSENEIHQPLAWFPEHKITPTDIISTVVTSWIIYIFLLLCILALSTGLGFVHIEAGAVVGGFLIFILHLYMPYYVYNMACNICKTS